MAHKINVPVEFRFEVAGAFWQIGIAKPVGWSGGPVLELIEPTVYRGFQSPVSTTCLPQLSEQMSAYVKRYEPWPVIWHPGVDKKVKVLSREIARDFAHHRIELLLCEHPEGGIKAALESLGLGPLDLPTETEKIDAWKLRDEFLRVERNTVKLAQFLNRWGTWSWENGIPRTGLLRSEPGGGPSVVFADSIWSDQDLFATALRSDPSEWLSRSSLGSFETRDEFPHFVRRVSTCRDAIEATITFDFVQGSRFRLCAIKECRFPFKLESDHKRKYCSQYHAHLASVRRNRKLASKSMAQTRRH